METADPELLSNPVLSDRQRVTYRLSSLTLQHKAEADFKSNLPVTNVAETLSEDPKWTTYHIWHHHESHLALTPIFDPEREKLCSWDRKKKKKKPRDSIEQEKPIPNPNDPPSFFIHNPTVAFNSTPRTLRLGDNKHASAACVIHNSWWWKRWKLQFVDAVTAERLLDRRGVVKEQQTGDWQTDDYSFKGYKVRPWRLTGESGKEWVREMNKQRADKNVSEEHAILPQLDALSPSISPLRADEVLYLDWETPLSLQTRRYHFNYANLDFYWKGTGTVREKRILGSWLRYAHLKLIVRLPLVLDSTSSVADCGTHEVCLAKYTSSINPKKSGALEIYDDAVARLVKEHLSEFPFPFSPALLQAIGEKSTTSAHINAGVSDIRQTRLYHIIVGTAVCMIIGEHQKREYLRRALEIATGGLEGAG